MSRFGIGRVILTSVSSVTASSRKPVAAWLVFPLVLLSANSERVMGIENPPNCSLQHGGLGNTSVGGITFDLPQAHVGDIVQVFPSLGMAAGACQAVNATGTVYTAHGFLTNFLVNVTLNPGVFITCPSGGACRPGPYNLLITSDLVGAGVVSPNGSIPGIPKAVRAVENGQGTVQTGVLPELMADFHTATISIVTPCIQVVQQWNYPPGTNCFPTEATADFAGYVTNCGDIRLTNVVLLNTRTASLLDTNGLPLAQPLTLNVGQAVGFRGSFVPTGAETCAGSAACITSATGTDIATIGGPRASVTNQVAASCNICGSPCITVTKNCDTVVVGFSNTLSGVVSNCGNITLTNVVVTDNVYGVLISLASLLPGTSQSYSKLVTIGGSSSNTCGTVLSTATATGRSITCGTTVSASASNACVVTESPCIQVTMDCPTVGVGFSNTVSGVVSNCGNVTLTNVVVFDNLYGVLTSFGSFPPGTSQPYNKLVTNATCGSITNIVTVTGRSVCGSPVFRSATNSCTVPCPPAIVTQPQSTTGSVGFTASFSVGVTGEAPLGYQWRKGGVNLNNETNATLALSSVAAGDAGNFDVVVTNNYGSVTSAVATLTVLTESFPGGSPTNSAISGAAIKTSHPEAGSGLYWLDPDGAGPNPPFLAYCDMTTAGGGWTLLLNSVAASEAPTTEITTSLGAPGLATGHVIAGRNLAVSAELRHEIVQGSRKFHASYFGNYYANMEAQGNWSWLPFPDHTDFTFLNNSFARPFTSSAYGVNWYWGGSHTTTPVNLNDAVNGPKNELQAPVDRYSIWVREVNLPPILTSQPAGRTNVAGTAASFAIIATGTPTLKYQWRKAAVNLNNETNSTLTLSSVLAGDAGNYDVVITNSYGSVTSALATLTVVSPPAIGTQPQSRTNIVGTTASFSVSATGNAPLAYQWRKDGANLNDGVNMSGATELTLWLTNVAAVSSGNYDVVVTNSYGSTTSAVATLTVVTKPGITGQPQSRTNVVGTVASFSVTATGTAPLGYQWRKDGVNLNDGVNFGGTAAATIWLTNVSVASAGNYDLVVTNNYGSVTSAVATLTVVTPPTIAAHPQDRTNVVGTVATFNVSATGTAPLAYQWRHGGMTLTGQTNTSLSLTNVQVPDQGSYEVLVSNPYGAVTSAPAQMVVFVCTTVPGLVSWWQAESNALDSVGTNHGTLTNGLAFVTGKMGLGFLPNGGFVEVPDAPSLRPSAVTVMAWVKPNTVGLGYILSKSLNGGVSSYALYGGSYIRFYVGHTNGAYTESATVLPPGNGFHHVVGTFDGTYVRIFMDGSEVGTGVAAPGPIGYGTNYQDGKLLIGAFEGNGNYNWGNVIDEVAVFERSLSSNEIAQIYQQVTLTTCTSAEPPAWIRFGTPAINVSFVNLNFFGSTNSSWSMERSLNVVGPWTNIGSFLIASNGTGQFQDTNPPPAAGYYRAKQP